MEFEIRDAIQIVIMLVGFGATIGAAKKDMAQLQKDLDDVKKKVHNGLSDAVVEIRTDVRHLKNAVFKHTDGS